MNRWKLAVSTFGAAALALGAGMYGCSEDANPVSGADAGSEAGRDASIAPDAPPVDDGGGSDGAIDSGDASRPRARADIRPTFDGGTVNGTAVFEEGNNAVTVTVAISGGFPAGPHGMHIHANGSCDPTIVDAGNDVVVTPGGGAGGHWNPGDAGHGFPDAAPHHVGDMGNILINDAGVGSLVLTSPEWRVQGDGGISVVGHAIVFHAGTDDGVSQPVGDAGGRPGCGVIQREP
jgi:Cu-Zn family superoxide dismutase